MESINSISELLLGSGSEYLCFDLGRSIYPLDNQMFFELEQGTVPVPRPRQQHGWFALLFWNKQLSNQHYIWFVKLPLDERGCIVSAARQQYLQIIVDALGQDLSQSEEKQGQLPDNPYSFVPSQQLLADFNSISRQALGLSHSQYFQDALNYLNQQHQNWQALSIQGIADLAAEIGKGELDTNVKQHFKSLAQPVKEALLNALEHQSISADLAEFFMLQADKEEGIALSVLRAIHKTDADKTVFIQGLLNNSQLAQSECLQVIAARHWPLLTEASLQQTYLIRAAELGLFVPLFQDLVQIPELRASMLSLLRDPHKPQQLHLAVGELFSSTHQS